MADDKSGPAEGAKGVVEDVKGKAKEAVGAVTGNENLSEEGKAQQDKADAQRDVAKKEGEAEAARAEAGAPDVGYTVVENDPDLSHADQLIDASFGDDVELVVIGLRRRSPVGKLFTGSAMQRVLLDAHCPVAAVKPPVRAAM